MAKQYERVFMLRLSHTEKAKLEALAGAAKRSQSDVMRLLIDSAHTAKHVDVWAGAEKPETAQTV